MFRIMVADDEPKTRRGLCAFLAGAGLPLAVCAQAGDGEEALRLLQEQRPDIVLLDICMPNMDGLEFLSHAKKLGIGSKFIVLTGFDEFSFAQQSVALRAFAYLLKPVNEPELTAYLQQAIGELEAERTLVQKQHHAVTQVEANHNLLRNTFCQSWMDGALTQAAWQENAEFWGICWPEKAYLTLLRPDFALANVLHNQEKPLLLFGAGNITEELLADLDVRFCARHDRGYCAIITAIAPNAARMQTIADTIRLHLELPCQLEVCPLAEPMQLRDALTALLARLDQQARENPMIGRIKAYIEENYQDPQLSFSEMSRALGIGQPHLSRLIKSAFSNTYVGYLTTVRMRRAIALMAQPENKFSWIATQVGYSNLHYFSHTFKKCTGKSPSAYREMLMEKVIE